MKVLLRGFFQLIIVTVLVVPIMALALLRTDGNNIGYDVSWRGQGSFCSDCHSEDNPPTPPLPPNSAVFAITTSASTFTPGGGAITVTVSFGATGRSDHGFMITAADPDNGNAIVSGLTVTDATNTQLTVSNTAITHTQKLSTGTGYSMSWAPPNPAPRRVTFWASGVGANAGTGDSDVYRDSLTIFNDTFLPVELADFNVLAEGSDVILSWWTASETDNLGFDIEWRDESAEFFETIAFVEGAGTSSSRSDYSYRLRDFEPGRHFFRLRQIDFDGTATLSEQVEISVEIPGSFDLAAAYPNPFNPSTRLRLTVNKGQTVVITAVDPLGRVVAGLYDGWVAAQDPIEVQFDAADLPTGVYIVRAQGENFAGSRTVTLIR